MSGLSIRARLTAAFAAALILVLALASLFVYTRVSADLSATIDDSLRSRVGDTAALVASSDGNPPRAEPGPLTSTEEGFTQVLTARGRLAASTLAPGAGPVLTPAEVERARDGPFFAEERDVPGVEGQARLLARPVESGAKRFIVVASASTDDRAETLAGLRNAFLIGAPLALILASGLGYLLARRSLAPVAAMRDRAQEITLRRSGERLPLPGTDDEIRQLGETLNTMLDRIEASLERERVFVADASHELRTPLAILQAELELAGRPGRSPEELREALRSARDEVDRLSQLAEDLLVIASSDQGRLQIKREKIDVRGLLERVRDRFVRRAAAAGRDIAVFAPSSMSAEVDPLRIEQALGNLLDNALRHGDGEVRLAASVEDDRVILEVTDEGIGFPAGFEARAFERFTRADDGRTGGGSGLGLAIAQAIAQAHGGQASVDGSGHAGATVRLTASL
ncbi:MAG: sensor histidine kinase [Solirubrobacterales bacterium]